MTWLKGAHSISFGGAYTNVGLRAWASTAAKQVGLGLAQQDTVAFNMLDRTLGAANYPGGVNDTYVATARNLYALLTGRVTSITGSAFLGPDGTYKFNGERENSAYANQFGFFVSDSWRAKPNLTITAGVRYELQLPMASDGLYSRPETWQMVYGITGAGDGEFGSGNLYQPGLMTGINPRVVPYDNKNSAYNTDWNNFAPSFGVVWQPGVGSGFLSKILSTEPVFRGGYSVSYTRLGVNFFDANYSPNPGRSRAASRSATAGTPVLGFDGMAGAPAADESSVPERLPGDTLYPITPAVNENIDIHYPDWPVPLTHQYSLGFQRSLGRDTAIELRYVGNTNVGGWETWNMNAHQQWSILENGYFAEFQKAQDNLRANIVAGRGNTFEYTGAPGTVPLPIFMAYFKGIPLNDPRNQDPAQYASGGSTANFRQSAWYNSLNMYNPSVQGMAGTGTSGLQNSAFAANAATAGLPAELLHGQSGPGAGQCTSRDDHGQLALQRDAIRNAPSSLGRLRRQRQLPVHVRSTDVDAELAPRGLVLPEERRRPVAHVQDERDRAAPVRTWPALRQRRVEHHEPPHRRVGSGRGGAVPERRALQLRRVPPGWHERAGTAGDVQVLPRR